MKKILAQHLTVIALLHSTHAIATSSKQIMNDLFGKKGLSKFHEGQMKHIVQIIENTEDHFYNSVLNAHKRIPLSDMVITLLEKFPAVIQTLGNKYSAMEIRQEVYVPLKQLKDNAIALERIKEALDQQLLNYPSESEQIQVKRLKKKLKKSKMKMQKEEPDSIVHFFKDVIKAVLFRDTKESVSINTNDQPLDLSILDNYEQ